MFFSKKKIREKLIHFVIGVLRKCLFFYDHCCIVVTQTGITIFFGNSTEKRDKIFNRTIFDVIQYSLFPSKYASRFFRTNHNWLIHIYSVCVPEPRRFNDFLFIYIFIHLRCSFEIYGKTKKKKKEEIYKISIFSHFLKSPYATRQRLQTPKSSYRNRYLNHNENA